VIGQAIIIELVEGTATTGKKSRVCVVVGGLAKGGIGEPIEQPNLAETIRRRFAAIGGISAIWETSCLRIGLRQPQSCQTGGPPGQPLTFYNYCVSGLVQSGLLRCPCLRSPGRGAGLSLVSLAPLIAQIEFDRRDVPASSRTCHGR
jgi:hypothetical protein